MSLRIATQRSRCEHPFRVCGLEPSLVKVGCPAGNARSSVGKASTDGAMTAVF
jgi:hypothetical protein